MHTFLFADLVGFTALSISQAARGGEVLLTDSRRFACPHMAARTKTA